MPPAPPSSRQPNALCTSGLTLPPIQLPCLGLMEISKIQIHISPTWVGGRNQTFINFISPKFCYSSNSCRSFTHWLQVCLLPELIFCFSSPDSCSVATLGAYHFLTYHARTPDAPFSWNAHRGGQLVVLLLVLQDPLPNGLSSLNPHALFPGRVSYFLESCL